jgi:hypothetical protein
MFNARRRPNFNLGSQMGFAQPIANSQRFSRMRNLMGVRPRPAPMMKPEANFSQQQDPIAGNSLEPELLSFLNNRRRRQF